MRQLIETFATYPQTAISLRSMTQFGRVPSPVTLLRATHFMRDELPIRLAHRVVELETLPHDLSDMPSVKRVKDWYSQSFEELINFPHPLDHGIPEDIVVDKSIYGAVGNEGTDYYDPVEIKNVPKEVMDYNIKFMKCLENIKSRHDPVVSTIAQGIIELKKHWVKTNSPLIQKSKSLNNGNMAETLPLPSAIQSFLDRFYMSRIGIRMLIGQHVALSKACIHPHTVPVDYVGIICTKTNLMQVAEDAAQNASFICNDYYGLYSGPKIKFIGENITKDFCYVPSHLHHMIFELLKNSLRAVVESCGIDQDDFPEIKMIFAEGTEDLTIKISDEGGGIPRSGMPLIWSYMYTTAKNPLLSEEGQKSDFKAPLAGFGYGLPLSRLYSRYFGGDLKLISMEGYGTDAYLHLSKLSDTEEPLIN